MELSNSSLERHVLFASDATLQSNQAEGVVALPLPESLALEQAAVRFLREGFDLVIEAGAKVVVIEGYFSTFPPPTLTLDNGGQLSPTMVASFLEQGADTPPKYALGWLKEKFGISDEGTQTIGEIISIEGKIQVVRDGLVIQLNAGDRVLEGDIISTGKGAEVFMRFTDKMEFRLGEEARLAIDQYLYDEVSSSGIQVLSIIAGAFSYASGLIAGSSPASVRLQTPQGVIGIRGTTILGKVGDGDLSVTVLEGRVALLQDGREVAILDESFETLRVVSHEGGYEVTTRIASLEEILGIYDFLDGSEQQLRALAKGKPLPDEARTEATNSQASSSETGEEGNSEAVLLPVSEEVYITPVAEEEESESFLESEEESSEESSEENSVVTATQEHQENAEEDAGDAEENNDEEEISVEPQSPYFDATLSAGELSFAGSSAGVIFDFSDGSDVAFDDAASRVFAHGADVELVRQLQAGSESQFEFVASGVVDATGTNKDDTLTGDGKANRLSGGAGADTLSGGAGVDTYVFESGHGTDTVVDDGGKVVFLQGTGNDYAGATYAFTRPDASGEAVTLTVKDSNSNTLNVIEFTTYPSSGYTFYTRDSNGVDTEIPASSLVVPPQIVGDGSESNPFLATAGADTFTGSAGADWVSYEGDTSRVYVDLISNPANVGGAAAGDTLRDIQNLVGSDHNDQLQGNNGDNILRGGDGNDRLDGGWGADTLDGGAGEDTTAYGGSTVGVRVSLLLQGQAQIDFDGSYGFTANTNEAVDDILSNIENIGGTNRNDWLTGDGNDNEIYGAGGDDRLEGGAGVDTYPFFVSGGWDTIVDDGGKIVFLHGGGNDYAVATYTFTRPDASGEAVILTVKDSNSNTLNVIEFTTYPSSGYTFYTRDSNGVDTEIPASSLVVPLGVEGSESNPYLATDAADSFTGSTGADWVSYAGSTHIHGVSVDLRFNPASVNYGATGDTLSGINNIIGSAHDDSLHGNSGDNILRGGAGYDSLRGGGGADTLDGGSGNEEDLVAYQFSSKGVRVNLALTTAQEDFDGTHGFTANQGGDAVGDILFNIEQIQGSSHGDWLTGDDKGNSLVGRGGDDRLEGGAGDDHLYGNRGNDNLYGNRGNDNLYGEAGEDTLEGGAGVDTYQFQVGDGTDIIIDEAGDTMNLRFDGSAYTATDFVRANINRVGDNLVITIDKDSTDGITDKITIENAYDTDTSTGTDNAAFTINIEFGVFGSYTLVTDDFWHGLT